MNMIYRTMSVRWPSVSFKGHFSYSNGRSASRPISRKIQHILFLMHLTTIRRHAWVTTATMHLPANAWIIILTVAIELKNCSRSQTVTYAKSGNRPICQGCIGQIANTKQCCLCCILAVWRQTTTPSTPLAAISTKDCFLNSMSDVWHVMSCLTFKARTTGIPTYLNRHLIPRAAVRTTCSSALPLLTLPTMHTNFGRRTFTYSAPDVYMEQSTSRCPTLQHSEHL